MTYSDYAAHFINTKCYMRLLLLCSTVLLNCYFAHAQTELFDTYDNTTGRANSAIYNGPIYINPFRFDQNTHQYFEEDIFKKGTVVYENQPYSVAELKYDVYQNKLILQSTGDYNNIAIDLITDKISAFTLGNKHFVKLDTIGSTNAVKNQFYEEIVVNSSNKIYVRHHKSRKEIFKGDLIMDRFTVANDYFLLANGKLMTINSKKDAISAYPQFKRSINDFASNNRDLSKSNRSAFMENLLRFIATLKN